MKFIVTLLLAGSVSAFAQETPTTPTENKGITQDAPKPGHPHKGGHKKHKKHHSKKQH